MSLEEIDLLFGERALGALPKELDEKDVDEVLRTGSITNKDVAHKEGNVSTVEKA